MCWTTQDLGGLAYLAIKYRYRIDVVYLANIASMRIEIEVNRQVSK